MITVNKQLINSLHIISVDIQLSPDEIELLNLFRIIPNKSCKALLAM